MEEKTIKENFDKRSSEEMNKFREAYYNLSPEEQRRRALQSFGLPVDVRDEDLSKAQELMRVNPDLTLQAAYEMIKFREEYDNLSPEEQRRRTLQSLGLPVDVRDEDLSKAQELMKGNPDLTLQAAYGMIKFREAYHNLSPEEQRRRALQSFGLPVDVKDEDLSKAQELMRVNPDLTLQAAYGMIKSREEHDNLSPEENSEIASGTTNHR